MTIPCKAKCRNQNRGLCQLDDERIRDNQMEFGEEWDPLENCECFIPQEGKKQKKKTRKNK